MRGHESLGLTYRLESSHSSLTDPCRLMRLLSPIIGVLRCIVNDFRHHFPMRDSIAPQLVGDYLPGLPSMAPDQSPEEPLCSCTITAGLEKYINHLTILVYGSPQVVLLTVDLHENFIDEEGITIASVLSFQSACINGTELDTPQADRFAANRDAAFS